MEIYDYETIGGKNLIIEYIESLSRPEKLELYDIRREIRESGLDAFEKLDTRQLRGKLWEIRASQTRVMYVIIDKIVWPLCTSVRSKKGRRKSRNLRKPSKELKVKD